MDGTEQMEQEEQRDTFASASPKHQASPSSPSASKGDQANDIQEDISLWSCDSISDIDQ